MIGLMSGLRTIRRVPKMLNTFQSFSYSSGVNLEEKFRTAQNDVKRLSSEPTNEVKLKLYGLYKQSTSGQCNTPKPSALNLVERAKWTAWAALGPLPQSHAMTQYVDSVHQLLKDNGIPSESNPDPNPGSSSTNTSEPQILVEKRSGVSIITLNRISKYNAITTEMYEDLISALNNASNDESIKLAVITGNGTYFSSGNDLSNFEKAYSQFKGDVKAGAEAAAKTLQRFVAAFIDFPKPLIGAVNGPAVGIAVTTLGLMDCVVVSDTATFQSPFSSLGQSPEACATYTFPYIMGYSRASEMLYFNYKMTAKEAKECGLVSRIVPSDQFKAHIEEWIFGTKGLVNTCYPKSMQFSKGLVRNEEMRMKLHQINKEECDTITERWTSDECISALQKFFTRKQTKL